MSVVGRGRAAAAGIATRRLPSGGVARVWCLNLCLVACGIWVYLLAPARLPVVQAPLHLVWWQLAVMFGLAEVAVVHIQIRRDAHSFSLSEVVLVLGLFFASPRGLVVAQVVGAGVALALHRRQSLLKLTFNLANFAVQAGVATALFHRFSGAGDGIGSRAWLAAFGATAVSSFASVLMIFLAMSLSEGRVDVKHLPQAVGFGALVTMTNTSLGLIGATVVWVNSLAALLLFVPATTLFLAYRAYADQREKHESLEFLYESTRVINRSPETESAVLALLSQARKMFRAEYAEVRILAGADGGDVLTASLGPDDEVRPMRPVPADLDEDGVYQRVAREDSALLLNGGNATSALATRLPGLLVKDAMLSPLRGETRVVGVIAMVNRLGDVSTFDAEDLKLFETFANHASIALENGRLEKSLAHVTELKEQMRHQAYHDPLTGLANRTLFSERVEHALQRGGGTPEPVTAMFIDLDDFKTVNDSLGHPAGDALLRSVAQRMMSTLRPGDTAARLGGDEFAVLLERTDTEGAREVAARILSALREPLFVAGSDVHVRASIGIAVAGPGCSTEELLRSADVAMYVAKTEGKARAAVFEPSMHARILERVEMEGQLRHAMARGELFLQYQPIVNLDGEVIDGVEALVRWRHPTRGVLGPDEFIPVAEQSGLMLELGNWVLEEACRQGGAWQTAGRALSVNVNLSVRQFRDPLLVDRVAAALEAGALSPALLILEITESGMIRDVNECLEKLSVLKALGVRIAVDDFGTGYSSLSYLKKFPINTLKIDRSFVANVNVDADDAAIVSSIIALAGKMGMQTMAEGVESAEHLEVLRRFGCDFVQGYFFSRAIPENDALRYCPPLAE